MYSFAAGGAAEGKYLIEFGIVFIHVCTVVLQHNYYLTHWKQTCAPLVAGAVCYYWMICYKNAQNIYFERCRQDYNWCLTDLSLVFSKPSQRSRKFSLAPSAPENAEVSSGVMGAKLGLPDQHLQRGTRGFYLSGRRHRGKASLCFFPVSSAVLAPIHRQLLIQHSWLEDHFSSYIICQPRGSKKKKESKVMKLNPRK